MKLLLLYITRKNATVETWRAIYIHCELDTVLRDQ